MRTYFIVFMLLVTLQTAWAVSDITASEAGEMCDELFGPNPKDHHLAIVCESHVAAVLQDETTVPTISYFSESELALPELAAVQSGIRSPVVSLQDPLDLAQHISDYTFAAEQFATYVDNTRSWLTSLDLSFDAEAYDFLADAQFHADEALRFAQLLDFSKQGRSYNKELLTLGQEHVEAGRVALDLSVAAGRGHARSDLDVNGIAVNDISDVQLLLEDFVSCGLACLSDIVGKDAKITRQDLLEFFASYEDTGLRLNNNGGSSSAFPQQENEVFDFNGDVDNDGDIDEDDLQIVLDDWGCTEDCVGDANGDGVVDLQDLLIVLGNWTGDGSEFSSDFTVALRDNTFVNSYDNLAWDGSTHVYAPGDNFAFNAKLATSFDARFLLHMDENTEDSSAYNNDAWTEGGTFCDVAGKFGRGCQFLDFDPVHSEVNIEHHPSLIVGGEPFALHMWVRTTDDNAQLLRKAHDSYFDKFAIELVNGRVRWGANFGCSSSGFDVSTMSKSYVNDGAWHYIVAVRDDAQSLQLFIDGQLEHTREDDSCQYTGIDTTNPVHIGHQFHGYIDEVMMTMDIPSARDVAAYYAQRLGGFVSDELFFDTSVNDLRVRWSEETINPLVGSFDDQVVMEASTDGGSSWCSVYNDVVITNCAFPADSIMLRSSMVDGTMLDNVVVDWEGNDVSLIDAFVGLTGATSTGVTAAVNQLGTSVSARPSMVRGDFTGDKRINEEDLTFVLSSFGPCTGSCAADLDADGKVSEKDVGELILLSVS